MTMASQNSHKRNIAQATETNFSYYSKNKRANFELLLQTQYSLNMLRYKPIKIKIVQVNTIFMNELPRNKQSSIAQSSAKICCIRFHPSSMGSLIFSRGRG